MFFYVYVHNKLRGVHLASVTDLCQNVEVPHNILNSWGQLLLLLLLLHCVLEKEDSKLITATASNLNKFSKFHQWQTCQ